MAKKRTQNRKRKWHDSWWFLIVFCILLPLIFRSVAWAPFHIPSGSMKSTLLIGDYLLVNKHSYGINRHSFPFGGYIPYMSGVAAAKEPKRGDIIVFRPPKIKGMDYIKRLVGMPGDVVQMKQNELYINNIKVPRVEIEPYIDDITGEQIPQYIETLPGGTKHRILDHGPNHSVDNTLPFKVPAGHYFMMGDNRDRSTDSRFMNHVGFIPKENLLGTPSKIGFSFRERYLKFWLWFTHFRGERFWEDVPRGEG